MAFELHVVVVGKYEARLREAESVEILEPAYAAQAGRVAVGDEVRAAGLLLRIFLSWQTIVKTLP